MIGSIVILLVALVLWISAVIPMGIATLLLLSLLPVLGISTFSEILSGVGVSNALFIMASGGITIAVVNSNIPAVVAGGLFRRFQKRPGLLLFLIGMVVTLFSGFMSSLATCVLFRGLAVSILPADKTTGKHSTFGKVLMMAIPVCAGIGGFLTPAGTPANLLILEYLKTCGAEMTFAGWAMVGIPFGLLASAVFLLAAILIWKPKAELTVEAQGAVLDTRDKLILGVVGLVIFGWFLGSWVKSLHMVMVAIWGLALLLMPPFRLLKGEEVYRGVNWDLVVTMGTVSTFMVAVSECGLCERIAELIFSHMYAMPTLPALVLISLTICLLRAFIPTTTAVVALFAPMLLSVAETAGISPQLLLLQLAFWSAAAMLLVYTEPILLITYKDRYYTGGELFRTGLLPSVALAVLTATALPWMLR